jgi:hypothetical protein
MLDYIQSTSELLGDLDQVRWFYDCDEKSPKAGTLKTFRGDCPNCGRHTSPSFYISLTETGRIIVNCFVCRDTAAIGRQILAETGVRIGHKILNDHIQAVLDAIPFAAFENKRTAPTDLMVLMAHGRIMEQCAKEIYSASVRQLALEARVGDSTVLESHKRLRSTGWLNGEDPGNAIQPKTYSLKVPNNLGKYRQTMTLNDAFRHENLGHHKNLIFTIIFNNPGITRKGILGCTGYSLKAIDNHLGKLLKHNLITTSPAPHIIGTIMIGERGSIRRGRPQTHYYASELPENNELTEAQQRKYQHQRNLHLKALELRKSRVGLSPEEWLCVQDGQVVNEHLNISTGELTTTPLTNYNKSKSYGLREIMINPDVKGEETVLIIKPAALTVEQIYAANYTLDGTLISREPPAHHHKHNCQCSVCVLREPVDEYEPVPDGYIQFQPDQYRQISKRETAEYRLFELPFKTCAIPKDSHFIAHDDLYVLREWLLGGPHSQALLDYLRQGVADA